MSRILRTDQDDYLFERRSSWSDCQAGVVFASIIFLILLALPFVF